jgi:hypothetical protein
MSLTRAWKAEMIPALVTDMIDYTYLQLAAGNPAAEFFAEKPGVSRRRAVMIRRRYIKNKKVDLSKYKHAEVVLALLTFLESSEPIISADLFSCFAAALEVSRPECMKGLLSQLLPYDRNLLHCLTYFLHRLHLEFKAPLQLLCDRFAPAIIHEDPHEKTVKAGDILKHLVLNYDLHYKSDLPTINITELVASLPEDDDALSADESDDQYYSTMVIRSDSPPRAAASTLFESPTPGESYGTMVIRSTSPPRQAAAAVFEVGESCGTMVVREEPAARPTTSEIFHTPEEPCGTMVIRPATAPKKEETKPAAAPVVTKKQSHYREPEEWEKNIIAVEKGEWAMSGDAFKRWNKQRPRMPSFRIRPNPETSQGAQATDPSQEKEISEILSKMDLPANDPASQRFARTIRQASATFRSFNRFTMEATSTADSSSPPILPPGLTPAASPPGGKDKRSKQRRKPSPKIS